MNEHKISSYILTPAIRLLYVSPFILGVLHLEGSLKLIPICLMAILIKTPSTLGFSKLVNVLLAYLAKQTMRAGDENAKIEYDIVKQRYGLNDQVVPDWDLGLNDPQFIVDMLLDLLQNVILFWMVGYYLYSMYA